MTAASPPDPLLTALRDGVPHSPVDWKIKHLWGEGFNTFDIALQLKLREHEVANRLMRLRASTDCQKNGMGHHD